MSDQPDIVEWVEREFAITLSDWQRRALRLWLTKPDHEMWMVGYPKYGKQLVYTAFDAYQRNERWRQTEMGESEEHPPPARPPSMNLAGHGVCPSCRRMGGQHEPNCLALLAEHPIAYDEKSRGE